MLQRGNANRGRFSVRDQLLSSSIRDCSRHTDHQSQSLFLQLPLTVQPDADVPVSLKTIEPS